MPIDMDLINRELALIDRENAFLLYATFCGDVERTAHALNISGAAVLKVVDDEGWNKKLASVIALKKSGKVGDFERSLNRALNYVQAHKFRAFVERVIAHLTGMNDEEFKKYLLTKTTKEGTVPSLSTRALADLASAFEKAQAMTYLALNDTAQERVKRNETADAEQSGGELHARIAAAMAEVRTSNTPRAMLLDAQLSVAQTTAVKARKETPLDNDDH